MKFVINIGSCICCNHHLRCLGVQGEMQKLQAEVAQLDLKLVAVSDTLAEATVAREDERQVHTSIMKVVSFMRRQTGQSACCPSLTSCALCLTPCNTGSLHRSCLSIVLLQVTICTGHFSSCCMVYNYCKLTGCISAGSSWQV